MKIEQLFFITFMSNVLPMKHIYLLIFILSIVLPVSSQITKDSLQQRWIINDILGCNRSGIVIGDSYELTDIYKDPIVYLDTIVSEPYHASFLYLNPDSTFISNTKGMCAMDVLCQSEGRYALVGINRIQFTLQRAIIHTFYKIVGSIDLAVDQNMGTYLLESTPKGSTLKFDTNDLTNQQLIRYSSLLDQHLVLINWGEIPKLDDKYEWKFLYSKEDNTTSIQVDNFNSIVEKALSLNDGFDISKVNILLIKNAIKGIAIGILFEYEGVDWIINYVQMPNFNIKEGKIYLKEAFAIVKG